MKAEMVIGGSPRWRRDAPKASHRGQRYSLCFDRLLGCFERYASHVAWPSLAGGAIC